MRFASHRDIARAVERGVRRAGLPVAYSAGFSPHPKISYAGGAPTGTASEAEYLEISLTRACAAADVAQRLDAALPDGIDVIEVVELSDKPGGDGALRLEGSQWRVVLPGVSPDQAVRAVEAFLAAPSVMVERLTSKGTRRLDARAAVVDLALDRRAAQADGAGCATLRMVVRHLTPAVRPDDILAALSGTATGSGTALEPSSPPLVTRLSQGPLPGTPGRVAADERVAAEQEETDEQLLRGAQRPDPGPRAREDDGRLPGCSTPSDTTQDQALTKKVTAMPQA